MNHFLLTWSDARHNTTLQFDISLNDLDFHKTSQKYEKLAHVQSLFCTTAWSSLNFAVVDHVKKMSCKDGEYVSFELSSCLILTIDHMSLA